MMNEQHLKVVPESFEYELVFYNDVQKEVENINTKTSSIYGSAPEPLIKQCVNVCFPHSISFKN